MNKYFASLILLSLGLVAFLEARGGYGVGVGGAYRGNPAAFQYQRTPTLSRAYPYNYGGGYDNGGTTVVEPNYYVPPAQSNPSVYTPQ